MTDIMGSPPAFLNSWWFRLDRLIELGSQGRVPKRRSTGLIDDAVCGPLRVIVAGSRACTNYDFVADKLDKLFSRRRPAVILCGECRGVDLLGKRWAIENGVRVESYPATWGKYGARAGPLRNELMAQNANALVAFWDGKSRGTGGMIALAKRYGLQIKVVKLGEQQ